MAHWHETPSHAWLKLTAEELAKLPAFARRPDYEEDCEYCIAVMGLPELLQDHKLFSDKLTMEDIRQTCRDYYPELFEKFTGEKCTPENSRKVADDTFHEVHAQDWIVICASGDWKAGVPAGFCECIATRGGSRNRHAEERVFYIPTEKYHNRGQFGYVVQPEDITNRIPVTAEFLQGKKD